MSGENSCFWRFLVKFTEVSAAGIATAISAYALAHVGTLSTSPTPTSAPVTAVQVGPTASEVADGPRAQPSPPPAAAAVNKQSPAPQQDTDATVALPARRPAKDATALSPRKHTKTDKSVAEKETHGPASVEALARVALANANANRAASNGEQIDPGLADTRTAPVDVQPRWADAPSRQADAPPVAVPPGTGSIEAPPHHLDVQSPAVVQPVSPIDIQPRPVVGIDPPRPTSEIPRPPMPVGTAPLEIR